MGMGSSRFARFLLHLGHGVVVELDAQAEQRRVVDRIGEVLPADTDGVGVQDLRFDPDLVHQAEPFLWVPRRGVDVADAPTPTLGVAEGVLVAGVVDGAPRTGLAERLPVDHPHVHAVDPLDMGDLVLIALRRALGEEVVTLRHVGVGVDHS